MVAGRNVTYSHNVVVAFSATGQQQLIGATNQANAATLNYNRTLQQNIPQVTNVTRAQQGYQGAVTQSTAVTKQFSAGLSQNTPFVAGLATNIKNTGAPLNQFNSSTTQAGASLNRFGGFMKNNLTNVALLSGGIAGLDDQFLQLHKAQVANERANLMKAKSDQQVVKIQKGLNDMIAEGKQGTEEYNIKLKDLELAQEKAGIAAERQTVTQENLNEATEDFWIGILPNVLFVGGSAASMISSMGIKMSTLKGIIPAVSGGFLGLGKAIGAIKWTSLLTSLAGIALPVLAAVAAIWLLVGAYQGLTNVSNSIIETLNLQVDALSPLQIAWLKLQDTLSNMGLAKALTEREKKDLEFFDKLTTEDLDKLVKKAKAKGANLNSEFLKGFTTLPPEMKKLLTSAFKELGDLLPSLGGDLGGNVAEGLEAGLNIDTAVEDIGADIEIGFEELKITAGAKALKVGETIINMMGEGASSRVSANKEIIKKSFTELDIFGQLFKEAGGEATNALAKGKNILNTLAGGAAGGTLTNKFAADAKKMDEGLRQVGATLQLTGQELADYSALVKTGADVNQFLADTLSKKLNPSLQELAVSYQQQANDLNLTTHAINFWNLGLQQGTKTAGEFLTGLHQQSAETQAFQVEIKRLNPELGNIQEQFHLSNQELQDYATTVNEGGDAFSFLADRIMKEAAPALEHFNALIEAGSKKEFGKERKDINKQLESLGLDDDTIKRLDKNAKKRNEIMKSLTSVDIGIEALAVALDTTDLKKRQEDVDEIVTDIIDNFKEISKKDQDFQNLTGLDDYVKRLAAAGDIAGLDKLQTTIETLTNDADGFTDADRQLIQALIDHGSAASGATDETNKLSEAQTQIAENNTLAKTINQVTINIDAQGTAASNTTSFTEDLDGAMGDLTKSNNQAARTINQVFKNLNLMGRAVRGVTGDVGNLTEAMNNIPNIKRTITITTINRNRNLGTTIQHGGSFVTNAQQGMSGIITRPEIVNGISMGEHSKPELITVTPLTNPNNVADTKINLGGGTNVFHLHIKGSDMVRETDIWRTIGAQAGKQMSRFGSK
jgi:hypothetical protein